MNRGQKIRHRKTMLMLERARVRHTFFTYETIFARVKYV